jgi:hypothetical protein
VAQDPWCREVELQLRRTLYRWKHMPADMVVDAEICIPKVIHNSGYGSQRECPLELILKDVSSGRYEPQRLWEWEKIARRLVRV